jgi:uncharacterized repeat protein (TIGR03803 family)
MNKLNSSKTVLAVCVLCAAMVMGAPAPVAAQTFRVLDQFGCNYPDGATPYAGVILDSAGNLYGTTEVLGDFAEGIVYKIDKAGTETVLHNFGGTPDGSYPLAGLLRDAAGNLYGTSYTGGAFDNGTVFKVDKRGKETVLYSFTGKAGDGAIPWSDLVRDPAGNLYGTTYYGGAFGNGTVFRLDPTNKETVLYSFKGSGGDGKFPNAGVIRDAAGNLYGTTSQGGDLTCPAHNDDQGCGTVFKVDKAGKEALLHTFKGTSDGGMPNYGNLLRDAAGNLYGTASFGGDFDMGVVFKLNKNGAESVLHNFKGGSTDGAYPVAGLVMGAAGDLYGTASEGGPSNNGIVFALDKTRKETVLHSFDLVDGRLPFGQLVRDPKGRLYGTTYEGGQCEGGTVFVLTP